MDKPKITVNPLFLKFLNKEISTEEVLISLRRSHDPYTAECAINAKLSQDDIDGFWEELKEAVTDIIKAGLGEEFKAFVNNYMEPSLEEFTETKPGAVGTNFSRTAVIKNANAPWFQGVICYNLCLYIRAFGLSDLKKCKICGRFFAHKGQYAVYCSDDCKAESKKK